MCDPVSLMVASMVAGVGGQLYTASANASAANYEAEISRQNAILADRRAKDALERGRLEEQRAKAQATSVRKQQEASFSAANIDTSYGSPLDVILSSVQQGELDAAIIRSNAEREAEDFEMQGYNARANSNMSRARGRNAMTAGIFASVGTALDGGAGVFQYRNEYG